jgi:hypothetical protein
VGKSGLSWLKKNDARAAARDGDVERRPTVVAENFFAHEAPAQHLTDPERDRRAEQIAGEDQHRSPPQTEKKSTAQTQHAAG